jgi:sugar/nucleoside kinase (ribokinase family)
MLRAVGRGTQEDARLDFVNTRPVSAETETLVLERLAQSLPELDALIVADYQEQGVLTPRVVAGLLELAAGNPHTPVVVDSRSRAEAFRSLILKPNEIEAARLFFPGRQGEADRLEADRLEADRLEALARAALEYQAGSRNPIFITRGAQGCLVCIEGRCEEAPGVPAAPPVDTVGAGDAFIAALAAALSVGAAPLEAACFANLAASITVKKIGVTGTASPAELLEQYDHWLQAEG